MPRASAVAPCGSPCIGSTIRYAERGQEVHREHEAGPMTSDSGILRRGFFTSPAVKVMLFHASAENSEPTCTTARITSRFTSTMGPPMPT